MEEIEVKCGRYRGKMWKKVRKVWQKLRESVEESEEREEEIKVKCERNQGKVRNKLRQSDEEIVGERRRN